MRCSYSGCSKHFLPISSSHLYCSKRCGIVASKHKRNETERARFIAAPGFPIPPAQGEETAERHSDDVRLGWAIDNFKPDRARYVRFGCPMLDIEREPDARFKLRWFPPRQFSDLRETPNGLNVPALALPRKGKYAVAYFDDQFRLIGSWKYVIYIGWYRPNLPWYLGDPGVGLRRVKTIASHSPTSR